MSTLLKHLSKLCGNRIPKYLDVLKGQSVRSSQTPPYLTMGVYNNTDHHFYDPLKEERTIISGKTQSEELMSMELKGLSHGWGVFMDPEDSFMVRISDFFLPTSSKSSPTIITLPPLSRFPYTCFDEVQNISMSSPPNQEEEDCVVAVKFKGFQMSLCMLGRDTEWTNIMAPCEYFHDSTLFHSKRDQCFYMFPPGRQFLASWSIHPKVCDYPKFHSLRFHDIPKLSQWEWEVLESCAKTEHLVEAPSGESFFVKWYGESSPAVFHGKETIRYETKRFMVFRHEENTSKDGGRSMWYTEDIGDLCIFLADNEPFCVQASSCPGLKPNSIYYKGFGFGVYDLAAKTVHDFSPESLQFGPYKASNWLPPTHL